MSNHEYEDEDEEEQLSEKDIFEDYFPDSLESKCQVFANLLSMGSFRLRLLNASSDIDEETRHGYDLVTDFVKRKKEFDRKLLHKNYSIARKKLTGMFHDMQTQIQSLKTDCALRVPTCMPSLMKFTKNQPDEYFSGKYNWYYTGGCLQHLQMDDDNHLAYVGGKSRDNLCIVPLKYERESSIDASNVQSVTASPGKEIFQIKISESFLHKLIGVRQKQMCLLYSFNADQGITECFHTKSDDPFASFDVSSMNEELCTINVHQMLSYWNIHRAELPVTSFFPSDNIRTDKWHNLWYSSDPSIVSLAGRKSIKWLDRRTNEPQISMKLASFKRVLESEEICVHFASKQRPHMVYVGTNMKLFAIDVRSPESVVYRWSHYMQSPPLYSSIIPFGDESEIACIGNQQPGNVILAFSNNAEAQRLIEIPSRMDSLFNYQASGLYLDPSIKPRMMSSLTGLTTLKDSKSLNFEVLIQTASSDIFSQALTDSSSTDANFSDLSKLISSEDSLHAAERWNMTELRHELSNKDLKLSINPQKKDQKQAWQISKQELTEYKDVLASIILAEWDVDTVQCQKKGLSTEQKVNAWLDSYNFESLSSSFMEQDPFGDG